MSTVVESTNMASTGGAARIFDCVATEVIENGMVGGLGDLAENETHIYKFVKGTPEKNNYVIVDQPCWDPDESRMTNQRRDQFVIPAGTPFRVRQLMINDEFGITKDGFTTATQSKAAVGKFVTVDTATGKLKVEDSEPASGSYMKIMRKRMMGGTLVTAAHTYGTSAELFELRVIR